MDVDGYSRRGNLREEEFMRQTKSAGKYLQQNNAMKKKIIFGRRQYQRKLG